MLLYLASTSPARLATLRAAGIDPVVIPSHVDEPAVVERRAQSLGRAPTAREVVALLAAAKAEAVAGTREHDLDGFVLGCDSVFEVEGDVYGKPHTPAEALRRWRLQRGRSGTLYSGHCLIDVRGGQRRSSVEEVAHATVKFASDLDDDEIRDYIGSGEPLEVAGAFTIDGLGGPFVTHVDGDPSTVIGLSLSTVRKMVREFRVPWTDFWTTKL